MNLNTIAELLKGSIDSSLRAEAEKKLEEVHKIIGFGPILLQVIMSNEIELPTRQAGGIYLKNLVKASWADSRGARIEREHFRPGLTAPFFLCEQDKDLIRENIVEAMVHAPDIIRIQLADCLCKIANCDFPRRWTQIVDKIAIYLHTTDPNCLMGALHCLCQLAKSYNSCFSSDDQKRRAPLTEAMKILLPHVSRIMEQLMPDESQMSVMLQKQILKIHNELTRHTLQLDLFSKEVFVQWMEVFRQITEVDVPAHTLQVNEAERPELIWWKRKKWAVCILSQHFDRFGSPGNTGEDYKEFSQWFLKTFSGGILAAMLKNLDQYRTGVYVSPRVMYYVLDYVNTAINYAFSWKIIKNHIVEIIKDIVLPLMIHSDSDETLWDTDPNEYINRKFAGFEDYVSPVISAKSLLHSACRKRKEMLQKTVMILLEIIQATRTTPSQKEGALYAIGTLADILLKRPIFKDQIETFLVEIVFKEFISPYGYLRARAYWVLNSFSNVKYRNEQILAEAFRLSINSLFHDKELPIKVEAIFALKTMLINNREAAQKYFAPQMKEILLEFLKIILETKNDDIPSTMKKFVKIMSTYMEQLVPVAVDICKDLVGSIIQVLDSCNDGMSKKYDENPVIRIVYDLLDAMVTIVAVMKEKTEVLAALEPIVLQIIHYIFKSTVVVCYDDIMKMAFHLTAKNISSDMWMVLEVICSVFHRQITKQKIKNYNVLNQQMKQQITKSPDSEMDNSDYLYDFMSILHNYIIVDTKAFLSNPDYMMMMYNMFKTIFEAYAGAFFTRPGDVEESEIEAAKLLEVIILQCKGYNIDQVIPVFVELVVSRLTKKMWSSELRSRLLLVIIAAMYYNQELVVSILENMPMPGGTGSVITHFIQLWIQDIGKDPGFRGLHDRKICVIGLSQLMQMSKQPAVVFQSDKIIPSLLQLFDGIKKVYEARAEASDSEDEDSDFEQGHELDYTVLDSDEDQVENGYLPWKHKDYKPYFECEKDHLERFTTPLDIDDCPVDEFTIFKDFLLDIQTSDLAWYQQLTGHLSDSQKIALTEVFKFAHKRIAAKQNKKIENAWDNK